jgi:hypothetical protein
MGAVNDFNRFVLPDNLTQDWLIAGSQAIGVGDFMFDGGSDVAKPADQLSGLASEALDQFQFAQKFIGVSQQQVLVSETSTTKRITIRTDGIVEATCPSLTWNKGDLVGIFSTGGGGLGAISPQQVDKVTQPGLAIGIVTKAFLSATTRVRFRILSRKTDSFLSSLQFSDLFSLQAIQTVTTDTDANQTYVVSSPMFHNMVPTAARTVTLPLETQSRGLVF